MKINKLKGCLSILFIVLFLCSNLANAKTYVYCTAKPQLNINDKICKYNVRIWWEVQDNSGRRSSIPKVISSFGEGYVLSDGAISSGVGVAKEWNIKKNKNSYIINALPEFKNVTAECIEKTSDITAFLATRSYVIQYANELLNYYDSIPLESYMNEYKKYLSKNDFNEKEYPDTVDTAGLKSDVCSIS